MPSGPLPAVPRAGGTLTAPHSLFFHLDTHPHPVHGMWAAERGRAILKSHGNRRVSGAEGEGEKEACSPLAV